MFYHNDHLGGVNVITDVNAARSELMEYDPWGRVSRQESNGSAVDATHAFTGQELDEEIDLYYYGGRYYDQNLARFIQPDPFVTKPADPQDFNRYSYALNNPYRYIDPTGYDESEQEDSSQSEETENSENDKSDPEPSPSAPETIGTCSGDCDVTLNDPKNAAPQNPPPPPPAPVEVLAQIRIKEVIDYLREKFGAPTPTQKPEEKKTEEKKAGAKSAYEIDVERRAKELEKVMQNEFKPLRDAPKATFGGVYHEKGAPRPPDPSLPPELQELQKARGIANQNQLKAQ